MITENRLFLAVFIFIINLGSIEGSNSFDIVAVRDSLDQITISVPKYKRYKSDITLLVTNQHEWETIGNSIKECLQKGVRNIDVIVDAPVVVYGEIPVKFDHLLYSQANVRIRGRNTLMIPFGPTFSSPKNEEQASPTHYILPYHNFNVDDVLLDDNNNPLSLYGDVFEITSTIEEVRSEGNEDILNTDGSLYKSIVKLWRFKTGLPDLNESECRDFYILLTRRWTSCRHRVVKVKDGYLYFLLKSSDAPSLLQMSLDPNSDMLVYKANPRCRYVNSPVSNGIHITNDSIYIPHDIKGLRIGKVGRLFSMNNCQFNSFEISGFHINGAGNQPCLYVKNSSFTNQLWIRNNCFSDLSSTAVSIIDCEQVCVYENSIISTRRGAISAKGKHLSVWKNDLKNIGCMLQTMAISFAGIDIHVFENTIEDFNYSAISCGSSLPNDNSSPLTYIIERNTIRYSKQFTEHYKERTLADGGGIYVGPQNTQGIIRYNMIDNIIGISINRGIFLDDGAKNLAIYGNLIVNTANCYDIDLRYCTTYSQGIPDHNTNNVIVQNIMTGSYRFEENNVDGSNCLGGNNVLLGSGNFQKRVVKLRESVPDKIIKGCTYKNGVVVIPKQYSDIIDSTYVDSFVRNHISIQ